MKQYREVTLSANEIDAVVCNMCGETIPKDAFGYVKEHFSAEKMWGYGSPRDGEAHSFDLCQECYEKIIAQFKIVP